MRKTARENSKAGPQAILDNCGSQHAQNLQKIETRLTVDMKSEAIQIHGCICLTMTATPTTYVDTILNTEDPLPCAPHHPLSAAVTQAGIARCANQLHLRTRTAQTEPAEQFSETSSDSPLGVLLPGKSEL